METALLEIALRQLRPVPAPPQAPTVDGFTPGYRAGLAFALLAPVALGMGFAVIVYVLNHIVVAANPWNMFGPGALLDKSSFADAASRHWLAWLQRLVPAALCALFWWAAHRRATRLRPLWLLLLIAIMVPALTILIGSPIYAWYTDPEIARDLQYALSFLIAGILYLNPMFLWFSLQTALMFFARAYMWLNPDAAYSILTAVGWAILLADTVGAWLIAHGVRAYAVRHGAETLLQVTPGLVHDALGTVRAFALAIARLAGLGSDHGRRPERNDVVARAVAWPWLIPTACTLLFALANLTFTLFPLLLALLTLAIYWIVRAAWRIADALHITEFALGAAIVGAAVAFFLGVVGFLIYTQSFGLAMQVGPTALFKGLTSFLPVFIAILFSIRNGLVYGWRSA